MDSKEEGCRARVRNFRIGRIILMSGGSHFLLKLLKCCPRKGGCKVVGLCMGNCPGLVASC